MRKVYFDDHECRGVVGRSSALPESDAEPVEGPVVVDGIRYVRAFKPLYFPAADFVPETKRHLVQRSLLFEI